MISNYSERTNTHKNFVMNLRDPQQEEEQQELIED